MRRARVHENPFRIGDHVTGPYFTDRAAEVRRILDAMRSPTRLLVFGPRRMGKSSALAVAGERARGEGVLVVRADLATTSGLVDVTNRLLRSLSWQRSRERLASFAAGLAPHVTLTFDEATGAPRVAFGVERRRATEEVQRRSLEEVVERLAADARSRGDRVAVVLDEFQAIGRFGGEAAECHLRDLVQRHGELSFVCAGSELSLIHAMLGKDRAFFRAFELLQLGPIDPAHLARWIDERLDGAGVRAQGIGGAVIEAAGPRTQDVLQVARHVYARALPRGEAVEGDVGEALLDVVREEEPVIRATWLDLTTHQQNVLRAVAAGVDQLFASATRDRFGLPTSSSVAAAVDALESRGLLFRDEGRVVFDSPFVRIWVEREALPDVPPA
ncbi:MAG TPA: ATP-binding protein [Longimicrobiales bacterium]|nr:ATP-binding protein [Longimicrobiales bacterium]